MNRFHVHLNVADLDAGIRFYSTLFAMEPTVRKADYAKWMLEDPRVNFAISNTGRAPGIDHLGIQVDEAAGLAELGRRLDAAGETAIPEDAAVCCYAKSDKLWTEDPQGTRWETFHTTGEATTYYGGESACATDAAHGSASAAEGRMPKAAGAACSPNVAAMKPAPVEAKASCCVPASGCC